MKKIPFKLFKILFWLNVDIQAKDQCWNWKAGKNKDGYGIITFERKSQKAHRIAFFLIFHKWPNDQILHECDNPSCCNPNHLFEGNHLANMQDMHNKGRQAIVIGDKNPNAILTKKQVIDIRCIYRFGATQQKIANFFKVSNQIISCIIKRQVWKNI